MLSYREFVDVIRAKGGVWIGNNIYFAQGLTNYHADYLPTYPQESPDDIRIKYNHITDTWTVTGNETA